MKIVKLRFQVPLVIGINYLPIIPSSDDAPNFIVRANIFLKVVKNPSTLINLCQHIVYFSCIFILVSGKNLPGVAALTDA